MQYAASDSRIPKMLKLFAESCYKIPFTNEVVRKLTLVTETVGRIDDEVDNQQDADTRMRLMQKIVEFLASYAEAEEIPTNNPTFLEKLDQLRQLMLAPTFSRTDLIVEHLTQFFREY